MASLLICGFCGAAEPFVNGEAVPYDPKYHERWVTQQTAYSDEVDTTDYGDEIKPPWWSMPKIWYGRAYLWWISHKNKSVYFFFFFAK